MALPTILRNAGSTILRTPLLWFFSVIVLITNDLPSLALGDSFWLNCLSLLLIPVTVLAEAGQIKSVQLRRDGASASALQIIRHSARRINPLIVVLVITILLTLLIAVVLWPVMRSLLPQVARPILLNLIYIIASSITYVFLVFAQCAIVISDLSLSSSLPVAFRILKKDALTVLVLAASFGLLRYLIRLPVSITAANLFQVSGYMLALLIVNGIQSAVFTSTYLYYNVKVQGEPAIDNPSPNTES